VRNLFFLLALFSIWLLIGGCSHLNKEVVILSLAEDCPAYQENDWKIQTDLIDFNTPTRELQCRLAYLRTIASPSILQSHLPSEICFLLAERETDQATQEKFAAEGVHFAEQAISLGAREDGRVDYYWAVNLGLVIRRHPALALKNIKLLAERLKSARQKVPAEDWGGPGRGLGMLLLKAPPWPHNIGDCDKALAIFKQTVEQFPQHPLNHLFYAQALWDIQESEALETIRKELETTRHLLNDKQWVLAKKNMVKELEEFEKELPAPDQ
jgi:hypothetical protein